MIRRLFLMAAVVVFALDMLGVWRRWSSVDPIALGLGLGFAAFLSLSTWPCWRLTMTVIPDLVLILVTVLLSSVLTLLLALAWWRLFLKRRLEAELEAVAHRLRERVKEGVMEAGQDLLPAFRQAVEAGFRDALTGGIAPSLLDKTAGTALRTGVSLVAQGLDFVRAAPSPESDKTAPTPE